MAAAETRRASNGSPGSGGEGAPAKDGAKRRKKKPFIILGALVLVGAILGGTYWWLHRNEESTDDAFVDGNIVQIRPQVSGQVVALHFTDNEEMPKGALLIEIDPRDYQAALERAQANVDAAIASQGAAEANLALTKATTEADIQLAQASLEAARHAVAQDQSQVEAASADADLAKSTLRRVQDLVRRKFDSQQQLDDAQATAQGTEARYQAALKAVAQAQSQVAEAQARLVQARTAPQQLAVKQAAVETAKAQVEQAQAELSTARLNLSYTKIRAPQAGRITKRAVDVGDVVQANQILTSMVVGEPWVTANFKETELTRMRPGQPVTIEIDTYPDQKLKGRVDSIQAGTGSRFSLLPAENATGNYVKVVQRVPVKIVFDDPRAIDDFLALGMSVVPTVDVAAAPSPAAQTAAKGAGAQ